MSDALLEFFTRASNEGRAPAHIDLLLDPSSGLRALLVLDDLTLGPAAGGIRTRFYPSTQDALDDALKLARAMTVKCALGGLRAGGGKCVVIEHQAMDRKAAFAELGRRLSHLQGNFRTAGDLGTSNEDLLAARAHCEWVNVDHGQLGLAQGVGRTVLAGVVAALDLALESELRGVSVGIQGAGTIGAAVAKIMVTAGARVLVSDLDSARASAVAASTGAESVAAAAFPAWDVDVLVPCAAGSVLTTSNVGAVRARAVVGGANQVFESASAEKGLVDRGIVVVPDVVSSSGAVICGIAATVMHTDPEPLLRGVLETTRVILTAAAEQGRLPSEVADAMAAERLERTRTAVVDGVAL